MTPAQNAVSLLREAMSFDPTVFPIMEEKAIEWANRIAGPKGQPSYHPDPVGILEMCADVLSGAEPDKLLAQALAPAPATSEGQEVEMAKRLRAVAAEMRRENPGRLGEHPVLPHEGDLERAAGMLDAAALALAGGDGWRPIESAPKDGTWIIAAFYRSGELRGLCHAKWATAAFFADLENGDPCQFCAGWYCPNAEDEICATYWRPLPAAPDGGEE